MPAMSDNFSLVAAELAVSGVWKEAKSVKRFSQCSALVIESPAVLVMRHSAA